MQHKQKSFIAGILAAGMFFSSTVFVSAETVSSSDVAALTAQVQALLAQIQTLQAQIAVNQKELVSIKQELALTRSLAFGSRGIDVSDLQAFLMTMPDVYPEALVTGFFGHATEKAIKKLQEKHGLEQAGIVGPKTREKLHQLFSEHKGKGGCMGKGGCIPSLGNGEHENKNSDDDNEHTLASTTPGIGKVTICHKPEHGNTGETITIATPALWAHMKHGDTMGMCGGDTGTTTPPDITAPVISSISASAISASTTSLLWNTNENADSTVWYSTINPVDVASITATTKLMNTALVVSHSIPLSGLTASTTYYYLVGSKDAVGNQATSSQFSFMTL